MRERQANEMLQCLKTLANTGTQGSVLVRDTVLRGEGYKAFVIIEAATFSIINGNLEGGTGYEFPVGTVITGEFDELQLASGVAVFYKR